MSRMWRWGLVIAAVLAAGYGTWTLSRSRSYQLFGELVSRVDTRDKVVALTFDDGPRPEATAEVLAMLAAAQVHATFYLVGSDVARNPQAVAAIAGAGHEIGNHTWSHRRMAFVTPGEVAHEVGDTTAAIRAAGYGGPITFRPPYGKKLAVLPWYLAEHDITSVTWDVEPETYLPADARREQIADYVLDHTRPGSIILMHVMFHSRAEVLAAVPDVVARLKAEGYRLVTVSELLALRQP